MNTLVCLAPGLFRVEGSGCRVRGEGGSGCDIRGEGGSCSESEEKEGLLAASGEREGLVQSQRRGRVLFRVREEGGFRVRGVGGSGSESGEREGLVQSQGRGRVWFRVRGEGGSGSESGEGGSGSESGEREGLVQGQDGLVACQLCTPDNASLVGRLESSDHQDVQCVSEFKCCYDTGEGRIVAHNLSY